MWFYYVFFAVITCIFSALQLSSALGLHVPYTQMFCPHHPPSLPLIYLLTSMSLFLAYVSLLIILNIFLSFPFFSSPHSSSFSPRLSICVRYQRQQRSAWLPVETHPWTSSARCHTGTVSKPVTGERWISHCLSDTCSSALGAQSGAFLLPSDSISPGRVCLFLGYWTLGVAWAAGGWSGAFVICWLWQPI